MLVQYEEGSAPALALKATMERTEKRFKNYGDAGLLCGTDGLPHLISDPGLALRYGHSGETLVRILATFPLGYVHVCMAIIPASYVLSMRMLLWPLICITCHC